MVCHTNFYASFQDPHFLLYIKLLSDHTFYQTIGYVQYNLCLEITEAIKYTSKERIYNEVGLDSVQPRCWFKKLCYFLKLYKNESFQYLLLLLRIPLIPLEMLKTYPISQQNIVFSKIHFFLQLLLNWTVLTIIFWRIERRSVFKNEILKFIRPTSKYFKTSCWLKSFAWVQIQT